MINQNDNSRIFLDKPFKIDRSEWTAFVSEIIFFQKKISQ